MTVHGISLPALDEPAYRDAAAELLGRLGIDDRDRVTIVADAHYPYHPTTGMVTNPAVVSALATVLNASADTAVEVVLAGGGPVAPQRTGRLLGYDRPTADFTLGENNVDTGPDSLTADDVPETLTETPLVVVPSARVDHEVGIAGAAATLTRAAGGDPTRPADVRTARDAASVAAVIGDATYAFTGDPYRAAALFASTDAAALDEVLASLLSVDAEGIPTAKTLEGSNDSTVSGLDLAALREDLPDGTLPDSDGPGRLVRAGYRLYTAISGDIYPPHLRGDG